jgi:hypothetical protein
MPRHNLVDLNPSYCDSIYNSITPSSAYFVVTMDPKTGAFHHGNLGIPDTSRVMSLFSLKGRTAIVSGAGAGIGLAIAHALAEAGANVAIWYNSNKQALKEAENIEKEYGVKCEYIQSRLSIVRWLM